MKLLGSDCSIESSVITMCAAASLAPNQKLTEQPEEEDVMVVELDGRNLGTQPFLLTAQGN